MATEPTCCAPGYASPTEAMRAPYENMRLIVAMYIGTGPVQDPATANTAAAIFCAARAARNGSSSDRVGDKDGIRVMPNARPQAEIRP